MGNFMVLNLFLALLLNSFNSEELKNKKEEVGDESKLAKSFERIRSLMRKGRFKKKPDNDDEGSKLEKIVHEIVLRQRIEKKGILMSSIKTDLESSTVPPIYSKSYQESLNRPLSGSDFNYDIPKANVLKTISGRSRSQETIMEMDDRQLPDDKRNFGVLHQMSSGFGTQQSKDEPNDSIDNVDRRSLSSIRRVHGIPQQIQKRQSCPMPRPFTSPAHAIDTNSNSSSCCTYSEISKQLKRLSSNQSINTLSYDQDDLLNQINLKDELLNCDRKELFQFLRDENFMKDSFENTYNERNSIVEPTDVRKSVHIQEEVEMIKSPVVHSKEMTTMMKQPVTGQTDSSGKPWHCLVTYVDDLTVGGRRNSQGVYDDSTSFPGFGRSKASKIPQDCFPKSCYDRCSCWDDCIRTKTGQKWTSFRAAVLSVVDTPAFEWMILVLIFASSVTLCFEDIHLDKNKELKRILYWTNFFFSSIFVVEMFLKWIAHGFTKYFSSFWTILDFVIVFVSLNCQELSHVN